MQGYLLRNKTRPREAVSEVAAWIESEASFYVLCALWILRRFNFLCTEEREAREKLKKLKEEEAKKAEEEVNSLVQ